MLFLITILLFVVLLGLYSAGMVYHKYRLKRESERSAVWQADEDFHAENPGMPLRYWKPHTWDELTEKITAAFAEKRYERLAKEYEYDCDIKDRFTFVIYAGSLLESV